MPSKAIPSFPPMPDFELWVSGRQGGGGLITARDGGDPVSIIAPPAEFDLLSVLVREMLAAAGRPGWELAGFIGVDRLMRLLKQVTTGTPNNLDPEPPHVASYVLRLRQLFAALFPHRQPRRNAARRGTPEWTRELIQNHRYIGYRIALPPERLHLNILADPDDDRGPTATGPKYPSVGNAGAMQMQLPMR